MDSFTYRSRLKNKSMIQISFKTQDQNIKIATIWNLHQNSHLVHDPQCFQNLQICSIYCKIHNLCAFEGQIGQSENPPPPPYRSSPCDTVYVYMCKQCLSLLCRLIICSQRTWLEGTKKGQCC